MVTQNPAGLSIDPSTSYHHAFSRTSEFPTLTQTVLQSSNLLLWTSRQIQCLADCSMKNIYMVLKELFCALVTWRILTHFPALLLLHPFFKASLKISSVPSCFFFLLHLMPQPNIWLCKPFWDPLFIKARPKEGPAHSVLFAQKARKRKSNRSMS